MANFIKKIYNKKHIVPILFFVVFVLFIITVSLNSYVNKTALSPELTPIPTSDIASQAQSVLSLTPDPVTLDANGNGIIDVIIETKTNDVTAIQLELLYDPSAITNVSIKPAQFFAQPVELKKRVNTQNGRITYMLGVSPTQQPIRGTGAIAKITFTKAVGTKLSHSPFSFYHSGNIESIVAATGVDKSVLKKTYDTNIILYQ